MNEKISHGVSIVFGTITLGLVISGLLSVFNILQIFELENNWLTFTGGALLFGALYQHIATAIDYYAQNLGKLKSWTGKQPIINKISKNPTGIFLWFMIVFFITFTDSFYSTTNTYNMLIERTDSPLVANVNPDVPGWTFNEKTPIWISFEYPPIFDWLQRDLGFRLTMSRDSNTLLLLLNEQELSLNDSGESVYGDIPSTWVKKNQLNVLKIKSRTGETLSSSFIIKTALKLTIWDKVAGCLLVLVPIIVIFYSGIFTKKGKTPKSVESKASL